ncbi:hypothetical protein LTR17_001919 [Elasticomyces elasticus]|nr:hypothetical protein LTR17_001919 [Elasticomyces elasticus]
MRDYHIARSVTYSSTVLMVPYFSNTAMTGSYMASVASNTIANAAQVTSASTTSIESLAHSLNASDKEVTCYIPACAYRPDSPASRNLPMTSISLLGVAAVLCLGCWALPRSWSSAATRVDPRPAATKKRSDERAGSNAEGEEDEVASTVLCRRCMRKMCNDCRTSMKGTPEFESQSADSDSASDEIEEDWVYLVP